jgi:hypothetical protein
VPCCCEFLSGYIIKIIANLFKAANHAAAIVVAVSFVPISCSIILGQGFWKKLKISIIFQVVAVVVVNVVL